RHIIEKESSCKGAEADTPSYSHCIRHGRPTHGAALCSRARFQKKRRAGSRWLSRIAKRGKASFQVSDQVLDLLEADLQPDEWPTIVAAGDGAIAKPDGQGKALEAAPGIAEAEDLQRVEKCVRLALADAGEHEGEQARRPAE